MTWDGSSYQERFDRLAARGGDVHGEADLVEGLRPSSVLDAGCGTGRVAIELARRGLEVVGTDIDASMLAVARTRRPDVEWVEADLAELDLGRRFDLVVMAGNVLLFTAAGSEAAVVASCVRHLAPGGALVAGFQLDRDLSVARYDELCAAAGLTLGDRWSTWGRDPFLEAAGYAVSVHRAPG